MLLGKVLDSFGCALTSSETFLFQLAMHKQAMDNQDADEPLKDSMERVFLNPSTEPPDKSATSQASPLTSPPPPTFTSSVSAILSNEPEMTEEQMSFLSMQFKRDVLSRSERQVIYQ